MVSTQNLLGLSDTHIDFSFCEVPLHPQLRLPIARLKRAAAAQGFDLKVASGYRNYERQCLIWNEKVAGVRPLYDSEELLLDPSLIAPKELAFAIMRWSALPGTSRHHWGTDFDIYEANALGSAKLELSLAETRSDGIFCDFYGWLEGYLAQQTEFMRPYHIDTGGVSPEPWHLSYRPLSEAYAKKLTLDDYIALVKKYPFSLMNEVLASIEEIRQRFIVW